MSRQEIQSLHVTRGTDLLIYEASAGNGPVYLVISKDLTYSIHLKPGQYGFFRDETGVGEALISLVGGTTVEGKVIATIPATIPEGALGPLELTLVISK